MKTRNIVLLACCQMISATGSIVLVTLGGIIGSQLTDHPALATLPISIMIVSVAATTIPATMLMRAIGRRAGFALASLSSVASLLLACYALASVSFAWFVAAAAIFGVNLAFTQQYRFAAAESVEPRYAARAISLVLVGAIGGALVGPELVRFGQHAIEDVQYAGTLAAMALLYLLQAVLFLFLGPLRQESEHPHAASQRPLGAIVRQPLFIVAVLGGTAAYGTMTLIMTATPLSMHINDGFTLDQTARIIRSHVLGMYVPSLFSGFLMERLGLGRMMAAGAAALLMSCLVGLQGHSMMHYGAALVLLGIGWNFLYVGGTTMLTLTYSMAERFKAQAVNEFTVFGTSASASLLAGTILYLHGWTPLVLMPLPLLLAILAGLFAVRGHARLHSLRAGQSAA
ncbi:MAG TPA: MFS transporter [Woeseiaceae bacterium]|nr:MFS transporter [Woeseiaceae bacterium]